MSSTHRSSAFFEQAKKVIPGGVNSPVRAFNGIGVRTPPFIAHAQGAHITDVDGHTYIDYVGSWGPMILGHNHPEVKQAVIDAAAHGLSFGAPTEMEIRLAELVCKQFDGMDKVRMVSSGTEATMTAIRLARGYTKRDLLIKFEGCYHGHSDSLLIKAGSGLLTFGNPSSAGVPDSVAKHTLTLPYNDVSALTDTFARYGDEIAGVILEPIAGNMSCIPAKKAFIEALRQLCDTHRSVLIFDEVMTGFRVHPHSAAGYFGVTPDLYTLGKVIGGGMPVGAIGGGDTIMSSLAPLGPVYQAGTLSGNPLSMAAGFATLTAIQRQPDFYTLLAAKTQQLAEGLMAVAKKAHVPLLVQWVPGMFGLFFTDASEVTDYQTVAACDINAFNRFFCAMLDAGVYFAPSAYETGFMSIAHSEKDIADTISVAEKVFISMSS